MDIDNRWGKYRLFFYILFFSSYIKHRNISRSPLSRLNLPSLYYSRKKGIFQAISRQWFAVRRRTLKLESSRKKRTAGASFTCILAVQRFVFEGCSRGLCARARRVISVPTPSFLCLPLSLSLSRFPSSSSISSLSRPPSSCDRARVPSPFFRFVAPFSPLGYVLPCSCVITNVSP